ncbi:MarR family transcriptional regulator [Georgenia sp. 10Sc9-8]|uniref:MarR family transcriptional regulator n=1 Tax=Georgenia halotolerans TaxID=3028317 RepID=A0ABT5U4A3_9MICO|nr:MarR family transcriptional regulator [Georgenia halotolerans]
MSAGSPANRSPATAEHRATGTRPSGRADLATEVRVGVMRLSRRLRAEQQAVTGSVSEGQFCVLADLKNVGPQTPKELADREQVQPPSMTRTVGPLVELGLVARETHPDDRRQVVLSLTEAGDRMVTEARQRRTAWLARRLAGLTSQERETLRAAAHILRRIVED